MVTRWRGAAVAILVAVALPDCQADEPEPAVVNPASSYCEEQRGTLEIREDVEGNQVGWCVFEDGSECEEWAFYQGECEPGR